MAIPFYIADRITLVNRQVDAIQLALDMQRDLLQDIARAAEFKPENATVVIGDVVKDPVQPAAPKKRSRPKKEPAAAPTKADHIVLKRLLADYLAEHKETTPSGFEAHIAASGYEANGPAVWYTLSSLFKKEILSRDDGVYKATPKQIAALRELVA